MSYSVSGEIHYNSFDQAFKKLIQRHDVLRTVFVHKKSSKPRQVVMRKRNASVYYEDISHLKEGEMHRFIETFKNEDKETGFDLSIDIPIRLAVLKTSGQEYEIIWSFHHIIMDGWCAAVLMKEMLQIYTALRKGEEVDLPAVTPYKEYIKWLEKTRPGSGTQLLAGIS